MDPPRAPLKPKQNQTNAIGHEAKQATHPTPRPQEATASASKSLADITDERQLPLGYLGALITLFLFMVAGRVFYSRVC